MIYDVYLENKILRLFENEKDDKKLNKELKNIYDETKYVGILYHMARNYNKVKSIEYDEEKAIDLFCESAKAGDLRSIEMLAQHFINHIASYLFASQMWCKKGLEVNESELYHLDFQYLLAKNYIIEAITYDRRNQYEEALEMMKDLANQNYLPAIQFLQLIEK